jgi:hypothetical protein
MRFKNFVISLFVAVAVILFQFNYLLAQTLDWQLTMTTLLLLLQRNNMMWRLNKADKP